VAFEMAEFAKELGLDLIITDHHQLLDGEYPDAYAIVHSTKLCGTAVAWALIRDEKLLDLLAIATIADMIPLTEVNRAIVKKGLEILNKTERIGFLELFDEAGIVRGQISSFEIGHIIAPRLNAMGRLEHAIDSLRLLCTNNKDNAKKLAHLLGETFNPGSR
jgi:single-stranded-DNA-specific exonuclease